MTVVRRRSADRSGVVIGIDASYTGLSVTTLTYDGRAQNVIGRFPADKCGQGIDRLFKVFAWLDTYLIQVEEKHRVHHVCLEGYAPGRKQGREMAGELGAIVKTACRALGNPVGYPTIVSPSQLKKYVTGSGSIDKSVVIKHVYQRWGYDTDDDNAADSYGLARIAHALQWPNDVLLQFQRDVLGTLTRHTERPDDSAGSARDTEPGISRRRPPG